MQVNSWLSSWVNPIFCILTHRILALRQIRMCGCMCPHVCVCVCVCAHDYWLYRAVMMRMMHPIPISVSLDLSECCWVTAWQNLNPEEQWDGLNPHTCSHTHTLVRGVPMTKHCFPVLHTHPAVPGSTRQNPLSISQTHTHMRTHTLILHRCVTDRKFYSLVSCLRFIVARFWSTSHLTHSSWIFCCPLSHLSKTTMEKHN